MYFGTGIFPTGADTTVISGITGAISDNIVIVLAILAFVVGLRFVLRLFNKSLHGKV
jgi:hypothetical protein